jgi:hypothetical protein
MRTPLVLNVIKVAYLETISGDRSKAALIDAHDFLRRKFNYSKAHG